MENLLEETIKKLANNGKLETDVLWVGTRTHKTTWEQFKIIADTEYHDGFGGQEVARDLLIVGKDWWMERHEYDGSENWEFKTLITEPTETIDLKALTTSQSKKLGYNASSWSTLLEINGIE